jgi:menaquinol-cytochrome c reductase iron-sulfur subunit
MLMFDNPIRQPWDGMVAHTGCFVRNLGKDEKNEDQFQVFAVNCAHLGCPVSWFPQSGLFMCPCHGGVYYENGERASGPPPRGLFQCVWNVDDGKLTIEAPHLPTLQDTLDGKV